MSKWTEFVHSFSAPVKPVIEQLLSDSSLSITDLDALKSLSASALIDKFVAASTGDPSFIKSLATIFYDSHSSLAGIDNYLANISADSDARWQSIEDDAEEVWKLVVIGFRNDINQVLLTNYTQYKEQFDFDIQAMINQIDTDSEFGYAVFNDFMSDSLGGIQSKLIGLSTGSTFMAELVNFFMTKTGAGDWTSFKSTCLPSDANFTSILEFLEQDMTLASISYSTFQGYNDSEMKTAITTHASSFLTNFGQYLYYYRENGWNRFKNASISDLEAEISSFSTSSECFIALAEMITSLSNCIDVDISGDYGVKGIIVDLNGKPAVGLKVKVYDKNYKDLSQVGATVTTNFDGEYGVGFDHEELGNTDKSAPDIKVKVFEVDGETLIRESPCISNAKDTTELNMAIGAGNYTGMVEYEIINRKLSRVIGDDDVSDDTVCDTANLANRFNFGLDETSKYIAARQLHQYVEDIDTEVFYGLLREGMPHQFGHMLMQPKTTLSAALKRASNKKIIAKTYTDAYPGGTSFPILTFADYSIATLFEKISDLVVNTLIGNNEMLDDHISNVEFLTSTTLNNTKKKKIVDVLLAVDEKEKNGTNYWADLLSDGTLSTPQINALKLSVELATVLADNTDFAKKLIQTDSVTSINTVIVYDASDWETKISTHVTTLPEIDFLLTDEEDMLNAYIEFIMNHLEAAHPLLFLEARLAEQSTVPHTDFSTFITNSPDFRLAIDNVDSYISENPSSLTGISNTVEFTADLKTIARLYRICPDIKKSDVIVALWAKGIFSASKILLLGESTFLRTMDESGLSKKQIKEVYTRASNRAGEVLQNFTNLNQKFINVIPQAIPRNFVDFESIPEGYEDLETIIGETDFCSCKHCQSIFGPAAYLMDLLTWLKGIVDSTNPSNTLLDNILARRPELESILLNCDNTNTEIPFVDLVIELMEYMINKHIVTSPDWSPFSNEASFLSRQTNYSSAELRAFPEHVLTSIYTDVLPSSVYPWSSANFNLWNVQRNAFLHYLNLSSYKLALIAGDEEETVIPGAYEQQLDFKYIGLTSLDSSIIYSADVPALYTLYGYEDASAMAAAMFDITSPAPINVDVMLERTGLELDVLNDYLSSKFINPNANEIEFETDSCSLSDGNATIELSASDLKNFYLFYKLRQIIAKDILSLDKALGNATVIDEDVIAVLVQMLKLSDKTKIELEEISLWYYNLRTHSFAGSSCDYELVFVNPLTAANYSAIKPLFELNSGGTEIEDVSNSLPTGFDDDVVSKHIKNVQVINDPEYDALTTYVGASTRTLNKLSIVHHFVHMARSLKMSIAQILSLANKFGYTPFSNVYDFVERIIKLKEGPFSVEESLYLLDFTDTVTLDGAITEVIITDGLNQIKTEIGIKLGEFLPVGETDNKKIVMACIKRIAHSGLEDWQDKDKVNGFMGCVERRINGDNDPLAYANFMSFVSSLSLDSGELAALESPLFKTMIINTSPPPAEIENPAYLDPETDMNARWGLLAPLFTEKAISLDWENVALSGRSLVINSIATMLDMNQNLAEYLMTEKTELLDDLLDYEGFVANEESTLSDANFPEIHSAIRRIYKVGMVWEKLSLVGEDPLDIFSLDDVADTLKKILEVEPDAYVNSDFDNLLRMVGIIELNRRYKGDTTLLKAMAEMNTTSISAVTGWSSDLIDGKMAEYSSMGIDVQVLAIADAWQILKGADISYTTATEWNVKSPSYNDANLIGQAVKQKSLKTNGLEQVSKIRDEIRIKQRDVLISYLISNSTTPPFTDSLDIYDYLLADPEMGTCMPSSRILFASLSVQLFVNRILLGVEKSFGTENLLALTKKDQDEWAWRKNYRVWEANRKVFTYPENWMDPDLRDDKSHLFKKLEDELSQLEATDSSVSEIFLNYLDKLNEISRLEIAQMYCDEEENTVYVFARTRGSIRTYYFRQWVDDAYWTEWLEVGLEITSDNVAPYKLNNRLVLFWLTFEDKGEKPENPDAKDVDHKKIIKLNWSELKGNTWSAATRSNEFIYYPIEREDDWAFHLSISVENKNPYDLKATVFTLYNSGKIAAQSLFSYEFVFRDGFGAEPVVTNSNVLSFEKPNSGIISTFGNKLIGQKFVNNQKTPNEQTELSFTYENRNKKEATKQINVSILGNITGKNLITVPHQYINPYTLYVRRASRIPIFFEDSSRTFFIRQKIKPYVVDDSSVAHLSSVLAKSLELDISAGATFQSQGKTVNSPYISYDSSNPYAVDVIKVGVGQTTTSPILIDPVTQTTSSGETVSSNVVDGKNGDYRTAKVPGQYVDSGPGYKDPGCTPKRNRETSDGPDYSKEKTQDYLRPVTAPVEYSFYSFYHPFLGLMTKQTRKNGVRGLLDPDFDDEQANRDLYKQNVSVDFFEAMYDPTSYVDTNYPKDEIDFNPGGGYSLYNWEIFYHTPMMMATRLMENQQFADAKKWLEYIFNPNETEDYDTTLTTPTVNHDEPERYWKIKPFKELVQGDAGERLISFVEGQDDAISRQIEVWKANPFSPYAIGRMRNLSFMKKAIMLYLDNLIAWGDYLFARDTMEFTHEAAQLYILAAQLLGKRPRQIHRDGDSYSVSSALADDNGLSKLIKLEDYLPANQKNDRISKQSSGLNAIDLADFCIPANEKMFYYWDTVADRLFKVRNCMNISGIVRKLDLFAPEIDPGALVRAFASGLGVSGALSEIYDRPSPYRFAYLYQKAVEYTSDVKSLGNSILSALEKKDGESLSILRSNHEINLLKRQLEQKKKGVEEAQIAIESATINKDITAARLFFYLSRLNRSKFEKRQLTFLNQSIMTAGLAKVIKGIAVLTQSIPDGTAGTSCCPMLTVSDGGSKTSAKLSKVAGIMDDVASIQSQSAGVFGIKASLERRDEEWKFQRESTVKELGAAAKQLESAKLRLSMAELEINLQEFQITQANEVKAFMEGKYTNSDLYNWMIGKLSKLYFDAYNLAYKMAKKAEKAYYYELGIEQGTHSFIQFNHWDNQKRGLLAGEGLHNDLKRLDTAYMENNVREFELTKQFSLALFNADQLIQLREKGYCDFDITEMMYDLDQPGHFYRRIKSVSLSMPCVAGPFTNISARLSLTNDKIRTSSSLGSNTYAEVDYQRNRAAITSIATSTGQNDSGVFELSFNDSRYLPFEYAGAISTWRLELPNVDNTSVDSGDLYRQFDYDTISDVILTIRYMARDGGPTLKHAALANINDNINKMVDYLQEQESIVRVISMKSEFPSELFQLLNPASGTAMSTSFEIKPNHFPFMFRTKELNVNNLTFVVKLKDGYILNSVADLFALDLNTTEYNATPESTLNDDDFGGLYSSDFGAKAATPIGDWDLASDSEDWDIEDAAEATALPKDAVEDILILIDYNITD